MPSRQTRILVVDDSEDDRDLLKLALQQQPQLKLKIETAESGEAALKYLQSCCHKPHLILLDMKMPRMTGIDLLRILKADPKLKAIAVCLFTTSSDPSDVKAAYDGHANAYLEKPMGLQALIKLVEATGAFWCQFVTFHEDGGDDD